MILRFIPEGSSLIPKDNNKMMAPNITNYNIHMSNMSKQNAGNPKKFNCGLHRFLSLKKNSQFIQDIKRTKANFFGSQPRFCSLKLEKG